jgi:hypothetical protein
MHGQVSDKPKLEIAGQVAGPKGRSWPKWKIGRHAGSLPIA